MELSFYLVQLLNAIQYGFLLFLVASGLTLLFGIMGIINLAHGSFYMIGAYLAYGLTEMTGSLWLGILLGLPIALLVGYLVERFAISFLYKRDHLYQVLLTFALILIFNELQQILWGTDVHGVAIPAPLAGSIPLTENQSYPVYRLFISAVCIAIAGGMSWVIQKTRLGMMIRAGASNREMVQALGIDVNRLFALVFSLGVALAAFAGMLAAPVDSVYPGMGENVLIISFVVVVIGGTGSIKGAFIGAMLIGLVSTFGKVLLPEMASIMAYALMALILLWRPQGLFGRAH
ncbi:branched-chain amino acid ABC transporter permease [Geothermobacter hydrogeniphilus]|uniref:Branched-chain amino acid ABC transporter permease n=1 Tax=Geothermobacter hydrogeniphilus TaxID=1969733 RepID=A0A2K2HCP0_9BACT|nr:branched-chain amino acid ABC transporter permease [Geothermobacter hydrogeniphilus]PNU21037.1 branched-chain amino acid ABC transporter permease [Geothermobacter hydrogeniphilus]